MIFVTKGDKPITDNQLSKRTQAYINRDWPEWKRERSMRLNDGEFNTYMEQVAVDTDVNRDNNTFNQQLVAYRTAVARLAQYVLSEGRPELTEMQPTGEYDENGEEVMTEVVVQTAVEPLPATIEVTKYDEEGNATMSVVVNPEIVRDEEERANAQAVIEATPQSVIDF